MGIRIDGASDLINATDGSLTIEGQSINSTGIGTFSGGVKVGSAATIHSTGQFNIGVAATVFPNGNATFAGIVTAASFVGDGSGLTNAGPSLTGSTNNTLVTVTGSNAIAGEATLTYNGTDTFELQPASATPAIFIGDSNRTGAGQGLVHYKGNWNGTTVARITMDSGADTTNKDDGIIRFDTAPSGSLVEALRIDANGKITIGGGIQDQQASDFNSGANQLLITSNASTGLTIDATSSTSSSIHFADGSTGSESYRGIVEYNHGSDYMSFATGGTHRARIDSSGRLIIGHNASHAVQGNEMRLQLSGTDYATSGLSQQRFAANGNGPTILFAHSRNSTQGSHTILQDDDEFGKLRFYGSDGVDFANYGAAIVAAVDGTPGADDMPGRLMFETTSDGGTTSTERMRINSAGQSLYNISGNDFALENNFATMHINSPTDGGQGGLYVRCRGQGGGTASTHFGIKIDAENCANNASFQTGLYIDLKQQYTNKGSAIYAEAYGSYNETRVFDGWLQKQVGAVTNGYTFYSKITETSSGGASYHMRCDDETTLKFQIERDGDVQNANNSYGSTSDEKLKENIVDAGSQWNDIKAVKVRNFNFIDDPNNTKMLGVVAQEIETVSAGLVKTENDITTNAVTGIGTVTGTTKVVKYSILYMKAVKALQEAMTRIETLESKVAALESA